jgi:hypothetical protein
MLKRQPVELVFYHARQWKKQESLPEKLRAHLS